MAFSIRSLTVEGRGKPEAAVSFRDGLNVIVGPSDTGKTYIFQCLDYALGASDPPKGFPQAAGYETVRVALRLPDGRSATLTRSLRGGSIRVISDDEDLTLEARRSTDGSETISDYLLGASGLSGKYVRTNASGETRPLSFRDVAHLAFVDEATVMTDRSPLKTGQWTAETVESRVFRLLLTGEDDSSVIAKEKPVVRKARAAERSELLETLIARTRAAFGDATRPDSVEGATKVLEAREAAATSVSDALADLQETAGVVEDRRRDVWRALRESQSRADVLEELQTRFQLLRAQYDADTERLASIAEVGLRVDQTPAERCPVCGATAENQDHDHATEQESPAEVRASCEAERAKIAVLIRDLEETLAVNTEDLAAERAASEELSIDLSSLDLQLEQALRPRVVAATEAFRYAEKRVREAEHGVQLLRYEDEFQRLLAAPARVSRAGEKLRSPRVSSGDAEGFARQVERLLTAWDFPEAGRVTFSEEDQDLVIDGRQRSSFGKGVLALTHAAFSLGLLRFCLDQGLPTPGFAAIDSPLVVYREPDPGEGEFPVNVKNNFYRSVAGAFRDCQVFVFENEMPPKDLGDEANLIRFTKAGSGRYGFIPS